MTKKRVELPPEVALNREIGERLKEFREESLHMSQVEMATQLKLSGQATYHTYESGRCSARGPVLFEAYASGCNLNWLISGNGPRNWHENNPVSAEASIETALEVAWQGIKVAEVLPEFSKFKQAFLSSYRALYELHNGKKKTEGFTGSMEAREKAVAPLKALLNK